MSEPETSEPAAGEELQFDRAEFAEPGASASATTCAVCKQPIPDTYFEVSNLILCPRCRVRVEASLTGGSELVRFLRAAIFGAAGAVAGFVLFFGVFQLTGRPFAIIAVVIGYLVGSAVRKGSLGRGGWAYQLLAIFLTYSAIAVSYYGIIASLAARERPAAVQAEAAPAQPGNPPMPAGRTVVTMALMAVVYLVAIYAWPIIVGYQSPISLLIMAFGLWEAWKLNRRMPLRITGPYRVGGGVTGPEGAPAHA